MCACACVCVLCVCGEDVCLAVSVFLLALSPLSSPSVLALFLCLSKYVDVKILQTMFGAFETLRHAGRCWNEKATPQFG